MSLDRYDVVSLISEIKKVTPGATFTVGEFANAIGGFIQHKTNVPPYQEWAKDGVDCCVLQPGSENWVKGKVRISLEFIPEEIEKEEIEEVEVQDIKIAQVLLPASPLDDLRKNLSVE
jgi:KGK domain